MFKIAIIAFILNLLVFISQTVLAQTTANIPVTYDYVPVISAAPITRVEQHSNPYQDCWTEQVKVAAPYPTTQYGNSYSDALFGNNSYTGTILGGLVGGGIGNALGHSKSNKKAGAIAGGLLGGAIGYDLTRNRRSEQRYHGPRYESQQRCKTRYEVYEEKKIVGYNVRYRYNGNIYSTRTRNDPGDRLRLEIVATPMEN